jgi:hypothetical protein
MKRRIAASSLLETSVDCAHVFAQSCFAVSVLHPRRKASQASRTRSFCQSGMSLKSAGSKRA